MRLYAEPKLFTTRQVRLQLDSDFTMESFLLYRLRVLCMGEPGRMSITWMAALFIRMSVVGTESALTGSRPCEMLVRGVVA